MAITKRFASENYVDTRVVEKATEIIENYEGSVKKAGDTMTGTLTAPKLEVASQGTLPSVSLSSIPTEEGRGVAQGNVMLDGASSRMFFKQFNADQDGASTKYCENYYLPKTNEGRTSNAGFHILTTKEAVTIEQGGTGAKTAEAALENLGAVSASEFNEYKDLVDGYDIPVSANNGVMQSIWEVVKSYLHHNNELVYAHAKGSDYDEQGTNAMDYETGAEKIKITRNGIDKTGWCINCSTFVHLVLLGVPYEKSMYNPHYNELRHNCLNSAGYSFNMWGEDITAENYTRHKYTWDIANRFRELGLGFYPNANYSNLAPGDVVFFKRLDPLPNRVGEFEQNIYHVGIVLAKHIGEFKENDQSTILYTFAEVMSRDDSLVAVRTITMDSYQLAARRVYYVGRPVYKTVPDCKKLIDYKNGIVRNTTFDVSSFDLRSQDMITLCFEYTPSTENLTDYVQCSFNDAILRRYLLSVTSGLTDAEKGVTKRLMLPVRLSDASPNGYLIDDSCNKINTITISGRATEEITSNGNTVNQTVNTNSITNLSIWEGLNGDFIENIVSVSGDTPSVPTKVSQLINDSGYLTSIPSEYVTDSELDSKGYLTQHQDLSSYAKKTDLFSKNYNDLTNKPVIPSIQGLASESYVNQQISKIQHPTYDDTALKNQIANKADKSELFSGNYEDLSNKPDIPSIQGLASENFVKNEIAKAQLEAEGDLLVNLEGFATKDDLNLKADKAEVPSIEGLASESYVQQELAKVQVNGGGGTSGGDDDVSEEEKEYVEDMLYSALGGLRFIKITQERFDALTTKDPNTIYIIVSADNMGNSTGEEGVTDVYNLKWTEGSNLSDTGSVVTNDSQAAYRLSDFVKVNSEYNYKIVTSSSSQFQVFYYDKNKNYIGKSTIRNDKTELALYGYEGFIEFPEDVKYLRIRTNNKTSSVEINELGKRTDEFVAFQFRNGYTVASNGSVSAASGYMTSGDIKLEPDYDYNITFNGNKTRIVFFNTDGNKTGNCLPSDSTYYDAATTLTRADIPEAAVSFRMRFATGGEVNMNNINEHLSITKTPKASKYIETISSWMQSKGFDENGEEIDDIAAMSTGYVSITSGYEYMYTLKQGVPFGFQVYYYDSNKTFISNSEVQDDPIGNKRFVIPSNAAYFRLKVSQENSLTFDNVSTNVEIKKIPAVEGMLYSFGVLSDVHVDAGSDGNFYDHNHATNDYRKAVKFLEDEGAEFIAYGGDMATGDPGVSEQDYRKVLDILKNSHIPSYMISGNHDYGYFFKALIESRKYYVVEKGNDMFIFVNAQDRGVTGGIDREIIDGVRALIDNNPNKRIFLFYHYFIRNHGSGDGLQDVKYYTGDTIGDDYEKYPLSLEWANLIINTPNLIFCHGHSHFRFKCQEVYEFNNYYHADGECHSVHIPSCAVPREMSANSTSVTNLAEGSEGYMVRVFADRVEFHAVQLSAYRYLTTYNFTINLPEGN